MTQNIDLSAKRHKLVHDGGVPKPEVLYYRQSTIKSMNLFKTSVTRYNPHNHKNFKTVEKS